MTLQSTPMPTEEDPREAARLALAGMRSAEQVHEEWVDKARRLILSASCGTRLTADGVIRRVGLPSVGTNKNNSVGAVFAGLSRQGYIEWTGEFKKSIRTVRHGNPQRVWKRTAKEVS